jgi:diadenosine tetraphosphate (Ap4A) HIT family hydrolase
MRVPVCPFCDRAASPDQRPPDDLVWRFPHSVAVLGPWQFYRGYCVLFSRRHASELSGLDDEERRAFLDEMCLLARAVESSFRPRKLNYELLGNQVPHLHWHLFPRFADDPDALKPVWLALDRAERDSDLRRRMEGRTEDRATTANVLRRWLHDSGAPIA